jgi:large subunit ribosomal protein L35
MKQKMKTRKAAAKRFKKTGTGKIKRYNSGMRHLLEHKKSNKKRNKRGTVELAKSDEKKIKRMIPGIK